MMTSENIGEIFNLLTANFGEKVLPTDPEKLAKVVNLWKVMFQDDDPAAVLQAVKNCIATLQFPPKIADIKQRIAKAKLSGQMTDTEAWQMVTKAVEEAGGYNDSIEAFSKLPPILQKLVGEPKQLRAWRVVDPKQLETVVMSTFVRSYRELAQREMEYNTLPADIQKQSGWMVEDTVAELPAPKKELTFEEMEEADERATKEYREKYLLPELRKYHPKHYASIMEKLGCG